MDMTTILGYTKKRPLFRNSSFGMGSLVNVMVYICINKLKVEDLTD
jgi:hypothetical protein